MDREKVIKETKDGIAFAESRGFGGLANTMRDALALLKEQQTEIEDLRTAMQSMIEGQCVVAGNKQQQKTGHWVAKSNVSWHENGDNDATPVFYSTLTCSECGKPYRYEVAHTFVNYDEWALAYVPNEPVLNDRRIPIYNKAFEEHKEKLKTFLYEWISCPYCGAKMEKQP